MDTDLQLVLAPYGKDKTGQVNQPNPTQQLVLDWVDRVRRGEHPRPGIPILYLQGGVGSGKTRALLAPANEMLLEISDLRALWGRNDFNDLRLSAMETFFEVMPPELIIDQNVQEHRYVIGQPDNKKAQVFFRELKDLSGLGSQEFGLIVVTEVHEITEQAFRTLKMRCRQSNVPTMILMEGNPPNKEHWLDRFTNPNSPDFDQDIEMIKVSTYENWENLSVAYRSSLETMPQAWKNKYLYGSFGFMPDGEPYYQGFNEFLHVGDFNWNSQKELLVGLDFGFHHPAAVFSQIDFQDRWVILKEVMPSDVTIDKFAEILATFMNQNFPNARCIYYGDPACVQRNDKSEHTSWQILASKGIRVFYRQSEYRQRKEIIERKLATLIHGKPEMLVDKSCRIIIDGFLGGYHYPKFEQGKPFGMKFEQPFKDGYYEHPMNALEYIAINVFSPLSKTRPGQVVRRPASKSMDNI